MVLDLRLDGHEFDSWLPRLVLGWVTFFVRANHRGIFHQAIQGNCLLPYTGREMSTGQNAVMLCGCGVKAGWLIPLMDKRVGGR